MSDEFNVVIQNSAKTPAIKLKPSFPLFTVEQFLPDYLYYPCNEGFILGENSALNYPALVITPVPVLPGAIILCRKIGLLEDKVVTVPVSKLTSLYDHVKKIQDLPGLLVQQIKDFYDHAQSAVA